MTFCSITVTLIFLSCFYDSPMGIYLCSLSIIYSESIWHHFLCSMFLCTHIERVQYSIQHGVHANTFSRGWDLILPTGYIVWSFFIMCSCFSLFFAVCFCTLEQHMNCPATTAACWSPHILSVVEPSGDFCGNPPILPASFYVQVLRKSQEQICCPVTFSYLLSTALTGYALQFLALRHAASNKNK